MNYVYGRSKEGLEGINNKACYSNQYYISARNTYNAIMNEAEEFIINNAPVRELIICRNIFNSGTPVLYKDDETIYCLTVRFIPRGQKLFKDSSKTLYAFRMTNELLYILQTEGWKYCSYNPGIYYYLELNDNKR